MGLEFLPGRIALPLERLAGGKVQPEQLGDLSVDLADDRVAPVEIAGLAGPEIGDSDIVGDLGRPPARIDPLDQLGAGAGVEETLDDEQVERPAGDLLDPRSRGQPFGGPLRVRARKPFLSSNCAARSPL